MTRVVVGLGGNALLRRGETADAAVQLRHIREAAPGLARLANSCELLIVHGNGPQVGMLAVERESDPVLTATYPLDALVAETQGLLGYWLQQAISNAGLAGRIASVVTQTVVDPADPAFRAPTKFIGRIYDAAEAHRLADQRGWSVAADGTNWRRVVASPSPQRIVESTIVDDLLRLGVTVICAGGAGSAVVQDETGLHGADAIVDKDHVAALLAITLHADQLVLLTDVTNVVVGYGTADARPLERVTVDELSGEGFAAGSMGPKVAAACHFADHTGRVAAIGALDDIDGVVAGRAGTQISTTLHGASQHQPGEQ